MTDTLNEPAGAVLFASEGAKVVVTDLDQSACDIVVEEIEARGGTAIALALNVADAQQIKTVVDEIGRKFGQIDILVNNAGVSSFAPLDGGSEYDAIWDRALSVMLTGL